MGGFRLSDITTTQQKQEQLAANKKRGGGKCLFKLQCLSVLATKAKENMLATSSDGFYMRLHVFATVFTCAS